MSENSKNKFVRHYLKHPSSYIVVILRSLMHQACVRCNIPIHTFEESCNHWDKMLQKTKDKDKENVYGKSLFNREE